MLHPILGDQQILDNRDRGGSFLHSCGDPVRPLLQDLPGNGEKTKIPGRFTGWPLYRCITSIQ